MRCLLLIAAVVGLALFTPGGRKVMRGVVDWCEEVSPDPEPQKVRKRRTKKAAAAEAC